MQHCAILTLLPKDTEVSDQLIAVRQIEFCPLRREGSQTVLVFPSPGQLSDLRIGPESHRGRSLDRQDAPSLVQRYNEGWKGKNPSDILNGLSRIALSENPTDQLIEAKRLSRNGSKHGSERRILSRGGIQPTLSMMGQLQHLSGNSSVPLSPRKDDCSPLALCALRLVRS